MNESRSARELLPLAAAGFGARVHAVPDDRWDASTPDEDWTVRDLVDHLVTEHLWAPELLRGATIEEIGSRFDGDVLGSDPVAAWDDAIEASLQAWASTPEDTLVHLSSGDQPAATYAEQMLLDLTTHAWDLARGAGLDERLDPKLVEHVYAYAQRSVDSWRGTGLFAEPVPVESDDLQDRMLGLMGRRP